MDIAEINRKVAENERIRDEYLDFEYHSMIEETQFLLQELEKLQQENERYKKAKDKAQIFASHIAVQMDRGGNLDVRNAFEKAQEIYEILSGHEK